ncbi:MAG: tetratricopeptide repeat protein [Polyangia bacterium]|jgi:hypothetical protein|nr:tetratricopeptide repeat protein [Polyangia bacterium]
MRKNYTFPVVIAALLTCSVLGPRPASGRYQAPAAARPAAAEGTCDAASVRKIKALNIDAMDETDRWELEKARQKLEDAKLVAQNRGCDKHPELAVSYVLLGVLEERERKPEEMSAAFTKALKIDPKVELPARVQTAKIMRLFAAVKASVAASRPEEPARPGDPRPSGPPTGFEHLPLVKWEEGATMTVKARAADDLALSKISIFFKSDSGATGRRRELAKGGGDKWTWSVSIPGTEVRGKQFSYFLVAYTAGDKEAAASGNSANMHMVQLTSAAASVPRVRDSGVENPLDGAGPRAVPRRVASGPDPALEDPDAGEPRREPRPDATVKRQRAPGPSAPPMFFASVGFGTGIGLMAGRTEVTNEVVPDTPSLGSLYGQFELGYLITQGFSLNAFARIGYLPISGDIKDPEAGGIPNTSAKGNDKDVVVLLRARYQSGRLLKAELPINLRWFAGGGLGWGIVRHLVNARHPVDGSKVIDTDRSTGFVPNVFGGVSLCVVRSCQVNVQLEVNYLATFTLDTDLNTPFHLDFTLGAAFAF